MMKLKNLPGLERAHLEGMRGNIKQNDRYASKASSLTYFGDTFVEPGARRDVGRIYEMVKEGRNNRELIEMDFGSYARMYKAIDRLRSYIKPPQDGHRTVLLLVGPPGCGKTRNCYKQYPDLWEPPVNTAKKSPTWFDGYDGQKEVLFDEFYGQMPLNAFLQITDPYYIRQVPVKGGFVWFNPSSIMITSNVHPSLWYDYHSRPELERALRRRITRVAYYDKLNDDFIFIDNNLAEGQMATSEMKKWWSSPFDEKNINDVLKCTL